MTRRRRGRGLVMQRLQWLPGRRAHCVCHPPHDQTQNQLDAFVARLCHVFMSCAKSVAENPKMSASHWFLAPVMDQMINS